MPSRHSTERTRGVADPVTAYAEAVAGGGIVAGPLVRLAGERHRRDLQDGPARGLVWRPALAARVIAFIQRVLTLPEGGAPFTLFPWQRFVVGSLYGWQTRDGTRRFRSGYVEAAKGSGKTPLSAALMLYAILEDGEPSAEAYSAAPSRDQSLIAFRDAAKMVQASPALAKQIDVLEQALYHPASGSVVRPLSSEARTLDGRRVHFAVLDELHEHGGADVVNKMRASTKGRRQPLILEITNAGWNRQSVCAEHHELTREILEGAREHDEWFGVIASLDEADDWRDEACWPKANLSLPALPGARYLREQVAEAEAMPSRQSIVRRLNFCEWVEAASAWLDMAKLRECATPSLDLAAFQGQACYLGLDIGTTESMTVCALCFRDSDGTTTVFVHGFIPEDHLADRIRRDRVPYDVWIRAGHVSVTPGPIVQLDAVRAYIRDVGSRVKVQAVAYDDWGAVSLAQSLEADGFTVVKVEQSPRGLSAACRELERLIAERKLRYASPVFAAHAANAMARLTEGGDMMPTKASDTARIDALSATLTALARAIMTPPPAFRSVYEDRGLLVV